MNEDEVCTKKTNYGDDTMCMTLLFHDKEKTGNVFYSPVHIYHECDTVDYLVDHPNKKPVCCYQEDKEWVQWFFIELTSEDVKNLKETSWYRNSKYNHPQLDQVVVEGIELEVFLVVHEQYFQKGE